MGENVKFIISFYQSILASSENVLQLMLFIVVILYIQLCYARPLEDQSVERQSRSYQTTSINL